eukprot:544187_1
MMRLSKITSERIQASKNTLKGWNRFKNWERNAAYLRTIAGLFCIAFWLNWAIAGATFAFLFHEYTSFIVSFSNKTIATVWDVLPTTQKITITLAALLSIAFRSYASVLLHVQLIQIVASICSFKLGLNFANINLQRNRTKNVNNDTDKVPTFTHTHDSKVKIRDSLISTSKLLNLANQFKSINSTLMVEYGTGNEASDSSNQTNHSGDSGESKRNFDDENSNNSNDNQSNDNDHNDDDNEEKDENKYSKCIMHKYHCNVSWHGVRLKQLEEENSMFKLLLQKQTTSNEYISQANMEEENKKSDLLNQWQTTNLRVSRKLTKTIIPNKSDELFCNAFDYMNKYFHIHNDVIEDYKSDEKEVKVIDCGIQGKATKETLYIVCEKQNKSNGNDILWKTNDDLYSASKLEEIYKISISKDNLSPSVTISDETMEAMKNAKEHLIHILKNEKQRNVMIGGKNTPWNNEEKIPVFNKATKQTGLTLMLEKHEFVQKLKRFANNNINDIKLIPIVRFNNENKYFYEIAWIVEIGKDINIAISFKHIKNKYLPSAIYLDIHDAHKLVAYKHNCDCLTNVNCFIDRLQIGENKQTRMYQGYKRKMEQKVNEQKNQIDQHENQMQDYLRLRAQDILIIDDMKLTCENLQCDLQSLLQLQCSVNQQQQTCNRLHELNTLHTLNLNSQTIPSNPFHAYNDQLTTQFNNLNSNQQQ